jgi:CheY-like chemotaxis protein
MRVLLVEHDAEQARLAVDALRREGFECVVADDEVAAAQALSSLGRRYSCCPRDERRWPRQPCEPASPTI